MIIPGTLVRTRSGEETTTISREDEEVESINARSVSEPVNMNASYLLHPHVMSLRRSFSDFGHHSPSSMLVKPHTVLGKRRLSSFQRRLDFDKELLTSDCSDATTDDHSAEKISVDERAVEQEARGSESSHSELLQEAEETKTRPLNAAKLRKDRHNQENDAQEVQYEQGYEEEQHWEYADGEPYNPYQVPSYQTSQPFCVGMPTPYMHAMPYPVVSPPPMYYMYNSIGMPYVVNAAPPAMIHAPIQAPMAQAPMQHVHSAFAAVPGRENMVVHSRSRGEVRHPLSPDTEYVLQNIMPRDALGAIRGHVAELSKSQRGCRYLQSIIKVHEKRACKVILQELRMNFAELITDPFGNYLFQKLIDKCTDRARRTIIKGVVQGKNAILLSDAATNLHGTRCVQKLIQLCAGEVKGRNMLVEIACRKVAKLSFRDFKVVHIREIVQVLETILLELVLNWSVEAVLKEWRQNEHRKDDHDNLSHGFFVELGANVRGLLIHLLLFNFNVATTVRLPQLGKTHKPREAHDANDAHNFGGFCSRETR